jgi:hypothetical protein
MHKDVLFTGSVDPVRPLLRDSETSEISPTRDYVLDELPADLAAVAQERMTLADLADKQSGVLEQALPGISLLDDLAAARVAQLDLLFMLAGFSAFGVPGSETVPRLLTDTISGQCARFPELDPHMSYELLVDVNSEEWERHGRMRVFSEGETGRLERDFYLGHYLAEPKVRAAYRRICALLMEPDLAEPAVLLGGAHRQLDEFRLLMAQYGKLSKDSFNSFRRYHMGHPGGPRGASGAFMPSVQLLELVLLPPTEEYGVYLDQSMPYFPVWARPLIAEWRKRSGDGLNVTQAVLDGSLKLDQEAAGTLLRVIDKFTDFRMIHLGVTKKVIPDAFTGGDGLTRKEIAVQGEERNIMGGENPGTSGFDVRNVLTNSVYRLLTVRQEIQAFHDMTD